MIFVYPSDDREEMIAGYALPDGRIMRQHVQMRPLIARTLEGIGNDEPEIYNEIHDGVVAELGMWTPAEVGAFGRFKRRIKKLASKVRSVAKKIAKNKLVKAAWSVVNNPVVMASMGPFASIPMGLSTAAKVVSAIKKSGKNPLKALGKLAANAVVPKDAIRLASRAIKGSRGDLGKAETALRKTALKVVAKKSPVARKAMKKAISVIHARTEQAAAKLAAPSPDGNVFSVKGPSGKLYHFKAA